MKRFFCFVIFGCLYFAARAQNTVCSPGTPPAEDCNLACINCDFSGFVGSTANFVGSNLQSRCGILQNDQWVGFVADTTSATFTVVPSNCANGEGVQIAIYADCSYLSNQPIACNGGAGSVNVLQLSNVPLIPGRRYFIVVDGYNGDFCDFSISVSSPQNPVTPGPVQPIQGPKKLCPNGTAVYSVPPIPNAETVTWNGPAGSYINGQWPPLTLDAATGTTVTVTFGSVGGSISVQPANPCRSGPVQGINVTVAPIPLTNLPQETVCTQDFPYMLPWGEEISFRPPGRYSFMGQLTTAIGCDSTIIQPLRVAPSYTIGPILRYVCSDNPTFTICGQTYTGPDPNIEHNCKTFLGCDSIIKIDLRVLAPVARIAPLSSNVLSCAKPFVVLRSQTSPVPSVKTWRNLAGVKLGQGDTLRATASGKYILESSMTVQGVRCVKYDTIELLQDQSLPNITASGALISCDMPQPEIKGGSTTAGVVFSWTGPGNFMSSTPITKVTKPGTYALTVKAPNGCSSTVYVDVSKDTKVPTVEANVAQNQPLTCARTAVALNGSANKPIASYRWAGPNGFSAVGQTTSVGAPGVYTLFATDTSNCSGAATVEVAIDTIAPKVMVSGGALRCPNSTARIVASANIPGVSFLWAGPNGFTAATANPLIATVGTYTVTAIGSTNGCTATATAVVTLAPQMVVQVSGMPSCSGAATGSATARVAGGGAPPYTFKWENGDTTATLTNLAAGTYRVTIQDLWCQTTATVQVDTFPSAKLIRASSPTCAGQLTGMASVSVGSGVPPYTYLWSNNRTDSAIQNLAKGSYTVTVKDGNGCTTQSSVKVSTVPVFVLQLQTVSEPSGYACRSTAVASLGVSPYTYQWSNGQTGAVASQLPEGAFSVVVKDATGCVASRTGHCGSSLKSNGVEEVTISPNPASTHLFLSARLAYPEKVQMSLLSATGQKLYEQTYQGDLIEERIDLHNFPSGLYLLRLATHSGFQQTEFVSIVR